VPEGGDEGAADRIVRGGDVGGMSHIFAKVGVANRTELATLAATRLPDHSA